MKPFWWYKNDRDSYVLMRVDNSDWIKIKDWKLKVEREIEKKIRYLA